MEKTKRLSLDDFKIKKLDNKNEIEKLLGGIASGCHITYTDVAHPVGGVLKLMDDDDCKPTQV